MTTDVAAALTRSYRIGKRRRVTFTAPKPERGAVLHMLAEWEPGVPSRLSEGEQADYAAARLAFMAELLNLMA